MAEGQKPWNTVAGSYCNDRVAVGDGDIRGATKAEETREEWATEEAGEAVAGDDSD